MRTACSRLARVVGRRRFLNTVGASERGFRQADSVIISFPCRSLITESGPVVEGQVVQEKTSAGVSNATEEQSALLEQELRQELKSHQELMDNGEENEKIISSLKRIRDCYQQLEWWDDALATESALLDYVSDNEQATADCYGRMGRFYLEMQKLRQAQRCFQTCLELLQHIHGPKAFHRDIGRACNDLARVVLEQGQTEIGDSMPYLEQAEDHYRYDGLTRSQVTETGVSTDERSYRMELPKVLKNQALLHRMNDRHDIALSKYQEALDLVQEEQAGLEISVSIADCLLSMEEFDQALGRFQSIVDDMDQQDETPLEGVLRHNLGLIHSRQGREDEALQEFQRAYDIKRLTLGESHHEVATTLNGLGAVHATKGNTGEALSFFQEALLICRVNAEKDLGDNDPNVQHALRNISLLRENARRDTNDPLGG